MRDDFFRRAQRMYLEEPVRRRPRVRVLAAAFAQEKGGGMMTPVLDARGRALAEAYLGLVRRLAAQAGEKENEDLFAAGCLGLCEAAAVWDGKGAFAAFAAGYIRREMAAQRRQDMTGE